MKRIAIIGSGGVGKSTLARKLGELTGIEVHHLDRYFWKPGWEPITKEELAEEIERIIAQESWIIDGNYMNSMEMRMKAADTVIYLDFSSINCLWGITKRRIMYANKVRPDMGIGCKEKVDWEFIRWVMTFRRRNRKKLLELMESYKSGKDMIILKNRRQVEEFLTQLQKKNQ